MPVFEKQKVIFIHIPKTGGTSIFVKNIYPQLDSEINEVQAKLGHLDIKHFRFYSKNFFTHLTFTEYEKYTKTNQYKIFTIVRNPYDRIFSYYKYHIYKLKINQEISLLDNEVEKFNKYLNYLLKDKKYLTYKTQTSFLLNKNEIIDPSIKIIKYENLNKEIKNLPRLNVSIDFISKKDIYIQENIEIVKKHFLEDFLNLGYSTEIEL
jgi:hypothetical protein